jgi:outer membrane protein OmpA-like peptidoglycan-associated protein
MRKKLYFLFLLLVLVVGNAFGQEAYKGQIFLTQQRFTRQGDMLHVIMHVDYAGIGLRSNETLTVTPVLKSAIQNVTLSSVIINGPVRHHSAKKADKQKNYRINVPVVLVKDSKKNLRSFTYKVNIPFEDWMEGSTLYIQTEESDKNGKNKHMYEDKILDAIQVTPAVLASNPDVLKSSPKIENNLLSWVNIIVPVADKNKALSLKGNIPFHGVSNLENLSEEKQNAEIYYRLRDAVRSVLEGSGTTITSVDVKGFTAPEGDYRKNEKQGAKRALSLKNYLRQNRVSGKSPLEVSWVAEDWDSITSLVKKSDMVLRDAALDIINSVDVVKGREKVLMGLSGGTPYKYLAEKIFPQVCRIEFEINYSQETVDTSTGRLLLQTRPSSLNLTEFFAVASSYPKGSKEYNDVFDLAARLFPDSPEANINAAAVALTKKDTKLASKYLERFTTLPIAYNNMGLLNLLEGNRDKAEVYFQMAAAAGVPQAKEVLSYLKNNK